MASDTAPAEPAEQGASRGSANLVGTLARVLSPRNIGAIYVFVVAIVVFSILKPDAFPTSQTLHAILNQYSITGIAALSLLIPLAAGYYDLSIGFTLGMAGVLVAYLLEHTALSPVLCVLITLCACVGIGLMNALIVVGLGVDSFIGTLGSGAIIGAITAALSGEQVITGRVGGSFSNLALSELFGVSLPVYYLAALMLALGWLLERTATGRSLYALGFDRLTAKLSGLRVDRLSVMAFVSSALIAGFAGIVLAARVTAGSPEAGPSYLIPAFSAAFLGATQFRGGRFNPWGAVVAVFLIGTGTVGLVIVGGPTWTPEMFEGVVLVTAVALTNFGQGAIGTAVKALRVRGRAERGGEEKS